MPYVTKLVEKECPKTCGDSKQQNIKTINHHRVKFEVLKSKFKLAKGAREWGGMNVRTKKHKELEESKYWINNPLEKKTFYTHVYKNYDKVSYT